MRMEILLLCTSFMGCVKICQFQDPSSKWINISFFLHLHRSIKRRHFDKCYVKKWRIQYLFFGKETQWNWKQNWSEGREHTQLNQPNIMCEMLLGISIIFFTNCTQSNHERILVFWGPFTSSKSGNESEKFPLILLFLLLSVFVCSLIFFEFALAFTSCELAFRPPPPTRPVSKNCVLFHN